MSMCGHGPFWLMIFSWAISLGARLDRRALADQNQGFRVLETRGERLTCFVWSFQTLTEWPASLEKLARVGTMFW